MYVPADDAAEASLIDGLDVYPVSNPLVLVDHLTGHARLSPFQRDFSLDDVDGEPDGSRSVTHDHIYDTSAPFMLGANLQSGGPTQYFDGLLDEWRVYDRALSGAEVEALMATSAPDADFSADPLTGTAPLTVTFANATGGAATYVWDFGDEVTSTLVNPAHTYTQSGVYTVSLTADGPGGSDTLTCTSYITVSGGTTYTTTTRVITYTYDNLYRLTDADYSTGEQFQYAYDAVGNRTVQTQTLTSTTVTTYTYDDANRLDYYYEDGVQTDLTWDDNPLRCAPGTVALSFHVEDWRGNSC